MNKFLTLLQENLFSADKAVEFFISQTKNSISELKELNTLLTEISKANAGLSQSDLTKMGTDSLEAASKYGKKAADYLSAIQEAARAGYQNKDAAGIAELSVAAQSACGITDELANKYLFAADGAYKFGGSIEKLTETLDGSANIAAHNALDMTELAEGMSIAGATAASCGVGAGEAAAALGTMIAATQRGGSEAADAFKAILLNLRQVSDEEAGIDAQGLAKYENACNALNVQLTETRNGISFLRDPMDALRDLSAEYNKLGESDPRKAGLLDSVGSEPIAAQLDALLSQWDTYETMLQQYTNGTGSVSALAEKTADSWEGSLNRLSNTWTDTVSNVVDSGSVSAAINGLNSLLSVINNLTDTLGSFGTIGLGAGLFAGLKNVGRPKMFGFNCCLNMPTIICVL